MFSGTEEIEDDLESGKVLVHVYFKSFCGHHNQGKKSILTVQETS